MYNIIIAPVVELPSWPCIRSMCIGCGNLWQEQTTHFRCLCISNLVCMYVCVCVYVCMYVCMYVCIYVCVYIHTHTYTYTHFYGLLLPIRFNRLKNKTGQMLYQNETAFIVIIIYLFIIITEDPSRFLICT